MQKIRTLLEKRGISKNKRLDGQEQHHKSSKEASADTAAIKDSVTVTRFFFGIPEQIPFETGTTVVETVGNSPETHILNDPWVYLRFHQVKMPARDSVLDDAVLAVTQTLSDVYREEQDTPEVEPLTELVTVMEAITPFESPDLPSEGWSGQARDLLPRADAFARCLRLVQSASRAYRLAADLPYGIPTYERLAQTVVAYTGSVRTSTRHDTLHVELDNVQWNGPILVLLENYGVIRSMPAPKIIGDIEVKFNHWMAELKSGASLMMWREHLQAAERAAALEGDFGVASVLAQTASELLLDRLLALLLWEEGCSPLNAATMFDEGKIVRRIKRDFPPRLGGQWQVNGDGAVGRWFSRSMTLRHRVVHGGFQPSRIEAESAIQSVLDLQTFVFDRVGSNRNCYPRTCILTLGEQGLHRRGLWRGAIKKFVLGEAQQEPNWAHSFRHWHSEMMEEVIED